jgi:hypothetical protein
MYVAVIVTDEVVLSRRSVVLVDTQPTAGGAGMAHELADDRYRAGDLLWEETIIEQRPHRTEIDGSQQAAELIDLLLARETRSLDAGEKAWLSELLSGLGVAGGEVERFHARTRR